MEYPVYNIGDKTYEIVTRTVLIGHVAVDSGQLMVCDPCYLDSWEDQSEWKKESDDENGLYSFSYNGACGATLSDKMAGELKFNAGHIGAGVAFASGFGDGMYPVYATYVIDPDFGKRISKVEIVMIDYNEQEEEDNA